MNKVKEIVDERVIPTGWNLLVSDLIGGALFVAQILVLDLLTVAITKAARGLVLKQIRLKDPMFAYSMWKWRFAITRASLR